MAVSGRYVYVTDVFAGLEVIDVSDPTNCARVGGYVIGGFAQGITLWRNYACVATEFEGVQVIDVSDPTNCVLITSYKAKGTGVGVTVAADRFYLADYYAGLTVLPSMPNLQFAVRVDAAPGAPFTIEAATNLDAPIWTLLITTNVSAMPFDYVDFDVKIAEKPQKHYRVRQP